MEYVTPSLTVIYIVEQDVVRTSLTGESERTINDLVWDDVSGGAGTW